MKILLLEDDLLLREGVEEFLIMQKYNVDAFDNSDDAFGAIFTYEYDLLLLDINVPGKWDGFSLVEELRKENKEVPIIFITSLSSSDALIKGYEYGCCDYIKKPFELVELKLRVLQALKTTCFKTTNNTILLNSSLKYDLKTFKLTNDDIPIHLSKNEHNILIALIKKRNNIVSIEFLYDLVWNNSIDPANARVQINNLKRKLPKNLIKNIYARGYILDC